MRWNIVIGISVAVLALIQLAITALGYFDPDRHFIGYGDMLFTAVAAIALLLTYPLLRRHNWARLCLIALLGLCALGVALLVPFSFIANHWIGTRLAISFSGLFTIAVLAIFIAVLLHADVRRDFSALPRPTKRWSARLAAVRCGMRFLPILGLLFLASTAAGIDQKETMCVKQKDGTYKCKASGKIEKEPCCDTPTNPAPKRGPKPKK